MTFQRRMHRCLVGNERDVRRMLIRQNECQMHIRKLQEGPGLVLISDLTLELFRVPLHRSGNVVNRYRDMVDNI